MNISELLQKATVASGQQIDGSLDNNAGQTNASEAPPEGGVSRRVGPGDVIIIPGHTPHWFSDMETDLSYLIFRPDPDNWIPLQ